MASSDVTLPRWLQLIFLAVAEAPWTGLKTLNALFATNCVLLFLAVAAVFQWELNEAIVDSVLIFCGSWLGIAGLGQIAKRMTYKPSPPYGPDIEDAQAGATSTGKPTAPALPQAGVKAANPAIVEQLEAYAARQRVAVADPPTEASD